MTHGLIIGTGKQDKIADHCYCSSCTEKKDIEGGHVNKVNYDYWGIMHERERPLYIIPLCKKCNNTENEAVFSVDEGDLVPAPDEYNVVGDDFV
jgi:hypothetical protein